ncbi:3-hydroxybutyryl-CoA dehydrogenase [Actinomadura gamaensis]|uniref:3-hydroxybutyryl-CoA dehydrogenase n=1 Tax=Actinomadura gamaensis TaxID=1763541 RepID=A0ABV9UC98_9ACTN
MTEGSFSKVGVVGLGTMGAGIAEVLARGGLAVVGVEINQDALERGRGHLEKSTGRAVKRGRLTADGQREILDRIALTTDFGDLADCDLVVEAVPERLDLKHRVFAELDKVVRDDAILATNTSSLSVTAIAAATGRPAQVVGVHFFNPAPVMKLVEVIGTVLTADGAVDRVAALVRGLGKTPVVIGDRAGFVANRLLFGYLNDAARMLETRHATRDDIDTAMTAGGGLPMGPFTLMDLIGLDTCLEVLEAIYAETRDRRHAPAPVLRELVTAGLLGRKTGRGFYPYGEDAPAASEPQDGPLPSVAVVGDEELSRAFAAAASEAGAPTARIEDADLIVASGEDADLAGIEARAKAGAVVLGDGGLTGGGALAAHKPEADRPLVEIGLTPVTPRESADRAVALVARLGLTPVRCRARRGFIVDALRFPYLNDAVAMLDAGYADADAIDAAMTLGCGYPAGPIAELDRLGIGRALDQLEYDPDEANPHVSDRLREQWDLGLTFR